MDKRTRRLRDIKETYVIREGAGRTYMPANDYDWLISELDRLRAKDFKLKELVNTQAKDEGLWFIAETAPEAYVQRELRKLHHLVEED